MAYLERIKQHIFVDAHFKSSIYYANKEAAEDYANREATKDVMTIT